MEETSHEIGSNSIVHGVQEERHQSSVQDTSALSPHTVSFAGVDVVDQQATQVETEDTKSNVTTQSIMKNSLFHQCFLIRMLEKIPLIIKLALIVLFCLLPTAIFGALLISGASDKLSDARDMKKLIIATVHLSEIVDSLQTERVTTALYIGSQKTSYIEELASARRKTDRAVGEFLRLNVTHSDVVIEERFKRPLILFGECLAQVTQYCEGINKWRESVNNVTNETFIPSFQYILDCNRVINDLIRLITSQSLDATFSIIHNSFNLITSFKEYRGIRRFVGTFGFLNGSLSEESIQLFKESRIKISNEIYQEFDTKVLNSTQFFICEQMEQYVETNSLNLIGYTVTEWYNNLTTCMDSLKQVELQMRSILIDYSEHIGENATNSLVGFTISIVFVILVASMVALLFSKTILGPWKKLLRLQEDVVYKFVPREFMSIIKKNKVTDLHHGDYFERELDIMFVDIRNYTALSERLPTDQLFKFLNRYLALIGPIVRRNFGYIDKYMGDGFIALFIDPGHALRASIEIQNCVRVFNDSLTLNIGPIAVGCGIVRGKCAVGLIGESKRMDPSIVGDSESLTKYYDAQILVSKSVTDSCSSSPVDDSSRWRSIGKVCVFGKREYVEIMEVIPFDNNKKLTTKEIFERSITMLFEREHFDPVSAETLLAQVAEIDPDDKVCKMRLLLAKTLVKDCSSWDYRDAPNTK